MTIEELATSNNNLGIQKKNKYTYLHIKQMRNKVLQQAFIPHNKNNSNTIDNINKSDGISNEINK